MAYMSIDKFGNKTATISLIDKKDTGYGKGYIEVGTKLYKVEVSPASNGKEYKGYPVRGYVKMTEVKKQNNGYDGKNRKKGF